MEQEDHPEPILPHTVRETEAHAPKAQSGGFFLLFFGGGGAGTHSMWKFPG